MEGPLAVKYRGSGSGHVLFVDDDPNVLECSCRSVFEAGASERTLRARKVSDDKLSGLSDRSAKRKSIGLAKKYRAIFGGAVLFLPACRTEFAHPEADWAKLLDAAFKGDLAFIQEEFSRVPDASALQNSPGGKNEFSPGRFIDAPSLWFAGRFGMSYGGRPTLHDRNLLHGSISFVTVIESAVAVDFTGMLVCLSIQSVQPEFPPPTVEISTRQVSNLPAGTVTLSEPATLSRSNCGFMPEVSKLRKFVV